MKSNKFIDEFIIEGLKNTKRNLSTKKNALAGLIEIIDSAASKKTLRADVLKQYKEISDDITELEKYISEWETPDPPEIELKKAKTQKIVRGSKAIKKAVK